ncbi:MAG: CmcJ/NvfI family oxidoreductase, partial [Alphaproteobacteria bacterium]
MTQTTELDREAGAFEAILSYAVDTGIKPVNETMGPDDISRKRTGVLEDKIVTMHDGRKSHDSFSLDEHGFELVDHPTAMKDFFDPDEIASVYYDEAAALIKQRSGASRVVIFDHTLRSGDQAIREEKLIREPVISVHNDYTEWSGPQRVRDILPDEAEGLLKKRFAVIQVWRAIRLPIQSNPLAIATASSLSMDDLIASERRYPDRIGETYQVSYNPDHQWYYFPDMTRDEALVFKVYDSVKDGRARFTAHTAFVDPNSPPDAAPRESIEIRSLAFFDD